MEPPWIEPKLGQSIRGGRHDRCAVRDVGRLATVGASDVRGDRLGIGDDVIREPDAPTLRLTEVRSAEPTPLARSASSPSKCTVVLIPAA